MAVRRARVGVGDVLELLHVVPEVGRLDTRHELGGGVVDLRVALGGRDRARRGRREQAHCKAQRQQQSMQTRPSVENRHEILPYGVVCLGRDGGTGPQSPSPSAVVALPLPGIVCPRGASRKAWRAGDGYGVSIARWPASAGRA